MTSFRLRARISASVWQPSRGVGRSFMKQLVEEREANGLFTSFQDFCERMVDRELNRRALESLIKAVRSIPCITTAVSF